MNKVILCIIDGFSFAEINGRISAVKMAKTPNLTYIKNTYPSIEIEASGTYVGLSDGQMGNSEVGHLVIGSGRIPKQSLETINQKAQDDSILNNRDVSAIASKNNIHLIGLLSDGGVHSHQNHLFSIIQQLPKTNNIYLHLFTDGRDVGIHDSVNSISSLNTFIIENKLMNVHISSIAGRYYGMDRDLKFERTNKAFRNITEPSCFYKSAEIGIDINHKKKITDEFIEPFAIEGCHKQPEAGDVILFFNFRTDRMRQICSCFSDNLNQMFQEKFDAIDKYTMTNYFADSECKWKNSIKIIIHQETLSETLSETISAANLSQVKITETEKYAHLTFFLNGLKEAPFKKEKRIMIPSPSVETYDLKPEMSIDKLLESTLNEIRNNTDVIFINVPNCDMVGHSGNINAAIAAVEAVDNFIGKIHNEALENDYHLIITSDHGNIENMGTESSINTTHTNSKVPFILASKKEYKIKHSGNLSNIAPTVLDILKIKKPAVMTGESLLCKL